MRIAIRGGHCPKVTGASALINELTEDRKVKDAVIKYLKQLGHEILDVTPPDSTFTSSEDLSYGVNKANNWRADLFISIHFNKAYDNYNGALGSEVCVYSTYDIAQRVVDTLASLGFKNRGQKVRTGLYELKYTNMKSMIVETCFVEATEDVELYKKLGVDVIGKAIAEAISNSNIETEVTQETPKSEPIKVVEQSKSNGDDWIRRLQRELNVQGFRDKNGNKLSEDGILGEMTISAMPVIKKGTRGNITKLVQELLVSKGYDTGGVDGIAGSKTDSAIRNYQRARNISVDGCFGKNSLRVYNK